MDIINNGNSFEISNVTFKLYFESVVFKRFITVIKPLSGSLAFVISVSLPKMSRRWMQHKKKSSNPFRFLHSWQFVFKVKLKLVVIRNKSVRNPLKRRWFWTLSRRMLNVTIFVFSQQSQQWNYRFHRRFLQWRQQNEAFLWHIWSTLQTEKAERPTNRSDWW